MPKFTAGEVVEPLQFDWNPHYDLTGTIAEPSEAQLEKFLTDIMAVQQEAEKQVKALEGVTDPAKLAKAMARLPEGSIVKQLQKMNKPYADLCSGFPSEEQIAKLPPRVRLAFFAWLGAELRPEASGAASSPAPASVS